MRLLRFAGTALLIAALVAVGAFFVLRFLQGTYDHPRDIAGVKGVAAITNMGAEIYAAKVGDTGAILFDTGVDVEGRPVDRLLGTLGATRTITHAFLTHGHFDHVAAVKHLQGRGTKVHAGAADADLLAMTRPPPRRTLRIPRLVFATAPSTADVLLEGRREIDVGGETVVAIPLPGHTPGTYLYAHRGVLYTGDAILYEGGKLVPGVDFFNEDTARNRASIAALDLAGVEVTTICTGHTGCTPPEKTQELLAALIDECAKAATPGR